MAERFILGQEMGQQSLAEKALFSAPPGKLTKKTFAWVYYQVIAETYPGLGTPIFMFSDNDHLVIMK